MPPITTLELASPSYSTSRLPDAVVLLSTPTSSISSSSSSSSLSASSSSSTTLPRMIAISLGIFGTLVILAGFVIVMRSRIRVRTELKRQNLMQDGNNRIYNAAPTTKNASRPQAGAGAGAAAEPKRLKALSFLQGREGPKEWIPGGGKKAVAAATAGGGESNVTRSKSLRKSFLTFSSSLTRKSTLPSSSSRKSTATPATLKPGGALNNNNSNLSTEYLDPAAAAVTFTAASASSSSTASPRSLEYQETLQDLTRAQRSNPVIATTVRLQRGRGQLENGLTVTNSNPGNSSNNNNSNARRQNDLLPPIPAQTMSTATTPPIRVHVKAPTLTHVEILSEPRSNPSSSSTFISAVNMTAAALPTVPPPIRPAPAPQLGINRALAISSPPPPPPSSRSPESVYRELTTPPGTRTERLPSVASTDEPSLISYYYDGPKDMTFGPGSSMNNERRPSTTSFRSVRRI